MKPKIVECVPNISEGRNENTVKECVNAVASVPGVTVLNYTSDPDHNRSVITFIGSPDGVIEAAVRLCKTASELIDLRTHSGEHPRMGAVDVIPFIPVKNATEEEVIDVSKRAAEQIWNRASIPVYLYEKSASAPHRENLADVRRGEFEGLSEKTKDPLWQPDFGSGFHESAGVSIVGARDFLIAYNLNLSTDNVDIAKKIAKAVRNSSGGLGCVKALGIMLKEKNCAQVSVNVTDFNITPLYRVNELVKAEAKRWGVHITSTELIGLAPMKALIDSAEYYLQIEDFDFDTQVLENHLL
ncbi:MAG: glutamate formimidoyltransferase [Clostridiales bacterium]|nr:glutamate formimidoyltransferase [Clostridiales bacterium]